MAAAEKYVADNSVLIAPSCSSFSNLNLSSAPRSIAVQSFDHSFDRAWNYAANASAFIMVHPIFLGKKSLVLPVDRYCTDLYRSWLASAEDGQNGAACVVRFLQEMAPRGCGCVASA